MLIYRAGRAAEREKRRGARILGAEAVTRESIELGFILGEIPGYEFSMGNFSGRPSLQKVVYLLQAFGVSLGYSFSWYLRGPYCSSLATNGFTPDRVYNFSDHDTQFKDRRAQKKLPRFPKFIRGKDLESLEILASARYLKGCLGYEETVRKILDKERTNFDESKVRKKLEYIRKEGPVQ